MPAAARHVASSTWGTLAKLQKGENSPPRTSVDWHYPAPAAPNLTEPNPANHGFEGTGTKYEASFRSFEPVGAFGKIHPCSHMVYEYTNLQLWISTGRVRGLSKVDDIRFRKALH